MKMILKYIKKRDWLLSPVVILLILAQATLELRIPDYVSEITLLVQQEDTKVSLVLQYGLNMLGCALLSLCLCAISSFIIARMAASLATDLRGALFHKTLDFSLGEMGLFGTSSLITRCTQDVTQIQTFFTTGLQLLIKAPFLAFIAIGKIAGREAGWTISTATAIGLILVVTVLLLMVCRPVVLGLRKSMDEVTRLTKEHLSGLRIIHAFHSYEFHEKRFAEANEKLSKTNRQVNQLMAFVTPWYVFVMYAMNLALYVIGIGVVERAADASKAAAFAEMIAFSSYALQIVQAFIFLIQAILQMPGFSVSTRRISQVLTTPCQIVDGPGAKPTETGTLVFDHVSFRYPGAAQDTLKDISFSIKRGQTVGFIGPTGCGKTTLFNLIPRFFDPSSGRVLIDGADAKDYRLSDLRNRLGYVPQKSQLFAGTIASNIGYGDNGRFQVTLSEIKKAAEVGQASEFIEKKPEGYDAPVFSGGVNFSGGQRQRLTISRAICRDPEIFLYDDSFSALDFATEGRLRASLREIAKDATVLLVGQRIGTLMHADMIHVMENGTIVGSGTHEELMRTCPLYQEIARTQLADMEQ